MAGCLDRNERTVAVSILEHISNRLWTGTVAIHVFTSILKDDDSNTKYVTIKSVKKAH